MAKRPHKTHDVSPRTDIDRLAFMVAFAVGVGGGVLIKLIGAHPFVTAGYAAAVLVGYAAATWTTGRLLLEPESIGDNCYYLGFLFTLTSLAVTLYQVADPPPGASQAEMLPSIISGFGVALSSTIVGVFLRVLMMQMRPDFVATEHEARMELTTAIRDFRTQLAGSLRDMKNFAVESVQLAQERDKRMRQSTEEFISEAQKELIKTQQDTMTSLESSSAEALKRISEEAERAFVRTTRSVEKPLEELGPTLEGLGNRISSIEGELQRTEKSIRDVTTDLEHLCENLESILKGLSEALQEADGSGRKLSSNLSRAATRLENKTLPALEALETRLARLPTRQQGPWDRKDPKGSDEDAGLAG